MIYFSLNNPAEVEVYKRISHDISAFLFNKIKHKVEILYYESGRYLLSVNYGTKHQRSVAFFNNRISNGYLDNRDEIKDAYLNYELYDEWESGEFRDEYILDIAKENIYEGEDIKPYFEIDVGEKIKNLMKKIIVSYKERKNETREIITKENIYEDIQDVIINLRNAIFDSLSIDEFPDDMITEEQGWDDYFADLNKMMEGNIYYEDFIKTWDELLPNLEERIHIEIVRRTENNEKYNIISRKKNPAKKNIENKIINLIKRYGILIESININEYSNKKGWILPNGEIYSIQESHEEFAFNIIQELNIKINEDEDGLNALMRISNIIRILLDGNDIGIHINSNISNLQLIKIRTLVKQLKDQDNERFSFDIDSIDQHNYGWNNFIKSLHKIKNPNYKLKPIPRNAKFLKNELKMGIKVEMEHTYDKKLAEKIAKHHLLEDKHYYTKLEKFEKGFKNPGEKPSDMKWIDNKLYINLKDSEIHEFHDKLESYYNGIKKIPFDVFDDKMHKIWESIDLWMEKMGFKVSYYDTFLINWDGISISWDATKFIYIRLKSTEPDYGNSPIVVTQTDHFEICAPFDFDIRILKKIIIEDLKMLMGCYDKQDEDKDEVGDGLIESLDTDAHINPGEIPFTNSTDMAIYEEMEKNAEYYKEKKGYSFIKVMIDPKDYIEAVVEGFYYTNDGKMSTKDIRQRIDEEVCKKYAEKMKEGSKFPILSLEYRVSRDGKYIMFYQEGHHRARAAQITGLNKVPVFIAYPSNDKELQRIIDEKIISPKIAGLIREGNQ